MCTPGMVIKWPLPDLSTVALAPRAEGKSEMGWSSGERGDTGGKGLHGRGLGATQSEQDSSRPWKTRRTSWQRGCHLKRRTPPGGHRLLSHQSRV